MHSTKRVSAILVGGLVAALLASCASESTPTPSTSGSTSTSSEAPEASGTLHLGVVTQLASFAPWEASWANQSPYLQAVYDTLLRTEPDGTIAPGLATKWEWNEDRTALTLTLRDNVTFSDGSTLTAQLAADNLLKFRDGTSENASFLAGVTDVEAKDEHTLVITLAAPDPALPVYLSQNAGLVGAQAMFDSKDAQTTPIGSGPYLLDADKTVVGSTWVFEKNPNYWNPEDQHYSEIDMTYYADPTALMNAVKGGQVDAVNAQSPTQSTEAQAAGYLVQTSEQNWVGFLLSDREGKLTPALKDVRVRQAFNYALDRQGLLKALGGGLGTVTTQVFSPNSPAYDPNLDQAYPYDPEKAKQLLAEAGYPDGFTLKMPSNNFVPESEFAIYKEQLGAVGINVEWEATGDDLFGRVLGGSWSAFSFLLQVDPTAWQTIQFSMLPESVWNVFHLADPKVLELADVVRHGEGDKANTAAQQLNQYIVDEAWYAPVYRPFSAFLTNDKTEAKLQSDNAVPYLWNIRPAQ